MQNVRHKRMKTLLLIIIMWYSNTVIASNEIDATYTFTSDCVTSVHIQKSEDVDYWDMFINVNDSEAKKLYLFTKKYLKKNISIHNAKGETLTSATIMQPFSSGFSLSADTKDDALLIKESLLNIPGTCGQNINAQ